MATRTDPAATVAATDNPASRNEPESVDDEHRAWVLALPVLRLTPRRFAELSEYSCSQPTGTTPGKMWKRHDGAHDRLFVRQGGKPRWVICQYDPDCSAQAKTIRVFYFRPIIVLTAEMDLCSPSQPTGVAA